jgi:PAS domain S-box-containing protein
MKVSKTHEAAQDAVQSLADRAEDELADFFERSPDLQCVSGVDGYFKRLNAAWSHCLGWTLEEMTARPFLAFVHPDDREETIAEMARLKCGAEPVVFENRYRDRHGSFHWLQWNARPVTRQSLIYATARDVTKQKWLEKEFLKIADREKEHFGRELHDGVCQSLTGIAALGSTLSRELAEQGETGMSAAAAEIADLLKAVVDDARDLSHMLVPATLRQVGLYSSLEALAQNVEHSFSVRCTLDRDGEFDGLPYQTTLHLFRIAQEAVHNAVVHGHADRIEIRFGCESGKGLLEIRDNGVGIPDTVSNLGGIGLQSMASRARMIRGAVRVKRRASGGTAVICVFRRSEKPGTGHKGDDKCEHG